MRLIDADDLIAEYTEKDIFRSAIDTYGAVMQITVAFEEMSELQKELCKHRYSDSWCEYVDDDDNFYCARGELKEGANND